MLPAITTTNASTCPTEQNEKDPKNQTFHDILKKFKKRRQTSKHQSKIPQTVQNIEYIDDDEESDSIVTNEIDSTNLDALFPESGDYENEEARKQITAAEKELVEFINKMKAVAYEKDGKEYVE